MGVGGHEDILEPGGLIHHRLLERTRGGIQLGSCVHGPKTRRGCNLIVPTAPGVKFGRDIFNFVVEHPIDECVHILIGRQRLCSGGELLANSAQAVLDSLAFFEGQNARPPKRDRPGLR